MTYWRFRQAQMAMKTISNHKPERRLCESLLYTLQPRNFERYKPSAGLAVQIAPLYPNVDSYTKHLKDIANLAVQEKPIDAALLSSETISVSVDRFLVTADGFYTPPVRAIENFQIAGLRLCNAMMRADTDEAGIYEHNLRVLTKLLINLRLVTFKLIEVSLAK